MNQLISRHYRNQLIELHGLDMTWGTTGIEYFPEVSRMVREHKITSLLDYGCGKGELLAMIRDAMASKPPIIAECLVRADGYDPAIEEYSALPSPAELIVSTDAFEHFEPENLDAILGHIAATMTKRGFFVIATHRARAILPDGRNAHLIQEGEDFWMERLKNHFEFVTIKTCNQGRARLYVEVSK
jgi:hypothetical protein